MLRKTVKIGLVITLFCAFMLTAGPALSADKAMHVAFDGIPEADMINFLIAVHRAEDRGVKVKISYLQSICVDPEGKGACSPLLPDG